MTSSLTRKWMMTQDKILTNGLNSKSDLDIDNVARLITAVIKVSEAKLQLAQRRSEVLTVLNELTNAPFGMWAWGVSDGDATEVAPVASIEVGFSDHEKTAAIKTGLDPAMHEEFRLPILSLMQGSSQCTCLRTDLHTDQEWKTKRMHANLVAGGLDEWMHSVRYVGSETWSSIWLLRRVGAVPFQPVDRQLIDLAMSSVTWLSATLDGSLPAESCVELTPRQRVVLMMQLDGLSRKQIAARLNITVDTVGDHTKKIYEHFDVASTGELAALFLRNR